MGEQLMRAGRELVTKSPKIAKKRRISAALRW